MSNVIILYFKDKLLLTLDRSTIDGNKTMFQCISEYSGHVKEALGISNALSLNDTNFKDRYVLVANDKPAIAIAWDTPICLTENNEYTVMYHDQLSIGTTFKCVVDESDSYVNINVRPNDTLFGAFVKCFWSHKELADIAYERYAICTASREMLSWCTKMHQLDLTKTYRLISIRPANE